MGVFGYCKPFRTAKLCRLKNLAATWYLADDEQEGPLVSHTLDPQSLQRSVSGPPDCGRRVLRLAAPVLLEQFLSFCVGFFDTYLSGQLGVESTSAVGFAAYVGWLASMLFGLVAAGTTALVARQWGAGERQQANRTLNRSLALAFVVGLGISAVLYVTAPLFVDLLGLERHSRSVAVHYLRFECVAHTGTALTLAAAAALRGAGDMRTPMWVLGLVSVLNVLFSVTFVYGVRSAVVAVPPMGVDGIVLGTVLARYCGLAVMLAVLARGVDGLQLHWSELRLRGDVARRILRIGAPAAIDGAMTWLGHLLFLRVISGLDAGTGASAAFAAHVVGIRVESLTYLPATAWGLAASTLVGQALGAGKPEQARRAGVVAVLQCAMLGAVIGGLFIVFADPIIAFMHDDARVRAVGVPAFRWLGVFQVALVLSIVYKFALRGAGDTRFPLWSNLFGIYCIRLPVAWWCAWGFPGGLLGAWVGMFADVTVRAVLVAWWFHRGHWTRLRI